MTTSWIEISPVAKSLLAVLVPLSLLGTACSDNAMNSLNGRKGPNDTDDGTLDGGTPDDGTNPGPKDGSTPFADGSTTTDPPVVPTGTPYVYIASAGYNGTATNLIYTYVLDTTTGALSARGTPIAAGNNPSYIAVHPSKKFLYVVNEGAASVASFAIDQGTGALTFKNRVASNGDGPTHLSIDRAGKYVLVANYTGGSVASIEIKSDGSLGVLKGSSTFGAGNATHWVQTDPANKYALAANKDGKMIAQLKFNEATGALSANNPAQLTVDDKVGPRHLDFHPNGRFAYVINEISNTLSPYSYNPATGLLAVLEPPHPTIPPNSVANTGAEIQVAPTGKFVYASNRGTDTIAAFRIAADGKLTLLDRTGTRGKTPRHFSIDPSGRFLFAANQDSGDVAVFKVDQDAGTLAPLGDLLKVSSPAYVGVVYLP